MARRSIAPEPYVLRDATARAAGSGALTDASGRLDDG
jgi:hypothetical protein